MKRLKSKKSTSRIGKKKGVEENQVGAVGEALMIQGDNEGDLTVTGHIESVTMAKSKGFMTPVRIDATIFNRLFTSAQDLEQAIREGQAKLYLSLVVPREIVGEEVLIGVDNSETSGAYYVLSNDPAKGILTQAAKIVDANEVDDE